MNIFILDSNPERAARDHCDKHVVKMILESAQLLSTASGLLGGVSPYKPTHVGHPCTKWCTTEVGWNYTRRLALELCSEFTKRYSKIHKTQAVLLTIPTPARFNFDTNPARAFGRFQIPKDEDIVTAYRLYYIAAKSPIARWSTFKPYWWNDPYLRQIAAAWKCEVEL